MPRHNLRLNGFALCISFILSLLFQQLQPFAYSYWYLIGIFFFGIFYLDNSLALSRHQGEDFTAYLLFSLSFKLLLVFIGLGTCAFFYRERLPAFAAHLIAQFFIYTIFSIRFVYLLVNSDKTQPKS